MVWGLFDLVLVVFKQQTCGARKQLIPRRTVLAQVEGLRFRVYASKCGVKGSDLNLGLSV
jgi:hypothetical protein